MTGVERAGLPAINVLIIKKHCFNISSNISAVSSWCFNPIGAARCKPGSYEAMPAL